MNFLLLIYLFSQNLIAKDLTEYECIVQPDLKFQLSLTDSKNPTVIVQKKNIKIISCYYQTLPSSKPYKKMNASKNAAWNLQLSRCEIHNEKFKNLYKFAESASFKQAQASALSYFRILKDQQPMTCKPKLKR